MLFSPSPPPLPPDAHRAVRDYEKRIRDLLESCADHQRHDPEVFLWNARRALEAICHLLLTVQRKKPSRVDKPTNETSLDGMIKQLKAEDVLDREQAPRFEMARSQTNLGVHIQEPEREDYSAAIRDTTHLLPEILDWLYDESVAKPYLRGREELPIEVIRAGGREGPSLKDAASVARTQLRAAELTSGSLRIELGEKEKALRARETRWWRWMMRLTVASVTCFSLGLCLGSIGTGLAPDSWFGALADSSPALAPAPPVATPLPLAPAVAAVTPVVEVPPSPAPAPAPSPIAAPATCPSGMLLIPQITGMRLGQPVGGRKNWPHATRTTLDPVDVPAFCLDPRPRARSSVAAADYDVAAAARCERNADLTKRASERTCISRDEAEQACAHATPGGHLPGIFEWESAARSGTRGLVLPEHEWVGERFPPAVFHRFDPTWAMGDGMWVGPIKAERKPQSPEGAVLLAWNQQDPTIRHVERTFRCAASTL